MQAEIKACNSIKQYTHSCGDFIFYKSMSFRSSYLENLVQDKNNAWNAEARIKAAEYYLEVLILQYNTLLFNCEKMYMELINYHLFVNFIIPLFEKKTFDQYLIILMVRSLASVILKKVWAKLVVLKERKEKQEENTKLQKEEYQERKLSEMAMSAAEQIQLQVDRSLEPKLEVLLAKKIHPTAQRAFCKKGDSTTRTFREF